MIIIILPTYDRETGKLSIKPVTSTVITIILQSTPIENNTINQSARLINYNRPEKTDIFSPSSVRTFSKNFKMQLQNIINAVVVLAAVAMARPQTPGQARRSLRLESRQDVQAPEQCNQFFTAGCPEQPSLCCPTSSLCFLDIDQQGQGTFQCF
jgi:hypothetical protein